jgi:hypothetical protein
MKLSDLRGEIVIDSSQAKQFVLSWFKPEDRIVITGSRQQRVGKFDVISQSMLAREFVAEVDDQMLRSLVFDDSGGSYNMYFNCSPVKEDIELTRRVKVPNVDYVPGVWVDLDVKPGCFESEAEILEWLAAIPLRPTIICGSGSGGVHAYWRLNWDERGDKSLVEQWWSYMYEQAGDRSIDKLVDITRMLRMPGTVRFPKPSDEEQRFGAAKVIDVSGLTYSEEEIRAVSHDAFERRKASRARLIRDDNQRRLDLDYLAKERLGEKANRWVLFKSVAYIEDLINERYTWRDILEPMGWTWLREQGDGSWEIARPGRKERSAVVDYDGSPVMSLLSSSEDTGLADLRDAQIPITRYRALLRLHYNDEAERLLEDFLSGNVPDSIRFF